MTINEFFTNNEITISQCLQAYDAGKFAVLFDDKAEGLDEEFIQRLFSKHISPFLERLDSSDPALRLRIGRLLLMKYYDNWKRELDTLTAAYDTMWPGGNERTETEHYHTEGKTDFLGKTQNQMSAFNDNENPSNTDNKNVDTDTETLEDKTVERSVINKANSVTYTQAEVIEKELSMRIEWNFFDIVISDIARELTIDEWD